MKILNNINNSLNYFRNLDLPSLSAYRTSLIVLIVVEMIGVYWYLGLKSLGYVLLFFTILGFVFIQLQINKKTPILPGKPEKPKAEPIEPKVKKTAQNVIKPEKKYNSDFSFNIPGLPSAEDYNKNLSKAFGSI